MRTIHTLLALCAGLLVSPAVLADTAGAPQAYRYAFDWTPAQRVVVEKAKRKLTIYFADGTPRQFDISLGGNPVGPKQRSGDSRTPEGLYVVDFKNLYSNYYLSVRLSYPSPKDRDRARKLGVDPGGNIMIHGMPNGVSWPYPGYAGQDWTDGCIAVSNSAMQEIWLAVHENTPVEIRP